MKMLPAFRPLLRACCVCVMMTLAGGGAACGQGADAPEAKARPKDVPVATVNGTPILTSDLKELLQDQEETIRYRYEGDPARVEKEIKEKKSRALSTLIDCWLLIDEFRKLGGVIKPGYVDKDQAKIINEEFKGDRDAFLAEVAKSGMTLEQHRARRERLIIINLMRVRMAGPVELTDEMVREHYEKTKPRWMKPERVKFHTVTIAKKTADARSVAESLHTKLVNGGDFEKTARESSQDGRAAAGGGWEWTEVEELNGAFVTAIKKMKEGEISEVLEQAVTFTIVRLDGRKESEQEPFETVKEKVRKSLYEEVCNERIEKRMVRLRETVDIQKLGPV